MASPVTPQQYISWVQRSLNRLIGAALVTKGNDTPEYREKVRDFKSAFGLGSSSEVGPAEQNALIKANHATSDYVKWAQKALDKVGAGSGLVPSGVSDAATRASIRSFQSYEGLLDDGWIGAKTETALIAASRIDPPGEETGPPKKPEKREEIVTGITVTGVPAMWAGYGPRCWAGAFAMMYSWKAGARTPIRDALDAAGGGYTAKYNGSQGLDDAEVEDLAARLGLTGKSVVPTDWVARLRDLGPLMVAQDPGVPGWLHWIVVFGYQKTAVFPDRSQDKEHLKYNDPFNGSTRLETLGAVAQSAKDTMPRYRWYHF